MIDVAYVYNTVRDLANKDQKGFVTPAVFNTFARLAQLNVYNEMFNELKLATRLRGSASDAGRDKSAYKQVEEDLSYFITRSQILPEEVNTVVEHTSTGVSFSPIVENPALMAKPRDLGRIISLRVNNSRNNIQVELLYDAEKINRVLRSNLSAPTLQFPVGLVSTRHIEVFPDTMRRAAFELMYYREPRSSFATDVPFLDALRGEVDYNSFPRFSALSVDESSGFVVQNPVDSRNFELPEHYSSEIIAEILQMIGVRLRDQNVYTHGSSEKQNN